MIDPRLPVGTVTTVSSSLGNQASGIAFDGVNIWTANQSGSVSIVTPGTWTVSTTNITVGSSDPIGIIYDGANIWVTDAAAGTLVKLDAAGAVLQTVTLGGIPAFPVFDGTSIWVPQVTTNAVTVVRASSGAILETLTGNGLNGPYGGAFDGRRILITNANGSAVSLWKAADLSVLGSFAVPLSGPTLATSDGLNFWITFSFGATGRLLRF
jgi:DNA-binding beta-propeller fold protein YncE